MFRFEGERVLAASTNNGVESANNRIKCDWTGHIREKFEVFLPAMEQMMAAWSRRSERKGFPEIPSIDLPLWDEAYKYTASQPNFIPIADDAADHDPNVLGYVVAAAATPGMSPEQFLALVKSPSFANFGAYRVFLRSWHILKKETVGAESFYTCSCRAGLKAFRCKHSVALDVKLDPDLDFPDTVIPLPINKKRGPGRPKKSHGGFGGRNE